MKGRFNPLFKKPGLAGTDPAKQGIASRRGESENNQWVTVLSREDADALLRAINAACAPTSAGHKDIATMLLVEFSCLSKLPRSGLLEQ